VGGFYLLVLLLAVWAALSAHDNTVSERVEAKNSVSVAGGADNEAKNTVPLSGGAIKSTVAKAIDAKLPN
jgi:hypothetical protein